MSPLVQVVLLLFVTILQFDPTLGVEAVLGTDQTSNPVYDSNTTLVLDETIDHVEPRSGDATPAETDENLDEGFRINNGDAELLPTVFIALLVRNKAHTLPYFLTLLQQLDYPKERIALWIRSDHNEDKTGVILRDWSRKADDNGLYHSISSQIVDSPPYRQSDQGNSPIPWTQKRFRHVIRLKEEALRVARRFWADYIWFLDADAFILNNQTLRHLISSGHRLVAPMLTSGGLYSNFWGGMRDHYYIRTEEYREILDGKKLGCFQVPMIHSAVLIDIRRENVPNFRPRNDSVPEDDIILLATSAKEKGIPMHICNDLNFGALLSPLDDKDDLTRDDEQLTNLRVEIAAYWDTPLEVSSDLKPWAQPDAPLSTIGFDKVYLINLKRRPDRLQKMMNTLRILGIDVDILEATDGKDLTEEKVAELGIRPLPDYRDPYSKRVMTFGEIGCFLSHYRVWEDMLKYQVQTALILEDDIRFEPYFVYHLTNLMDEAAELKLKWELMYLGRKRSVGAKELKVDGSEFIVHVDYSYWTLGYGLTRSGARKLIDAKPLTKLLPIDEFLPVMFNRHINAGWMSSFENRDLRAFSAEPLLLYPTHYTGEPGYISDTEYSEIIVNNPPPANCTAKVEL